METMEGTISNLQDTVSVSGGGNNGQASTTYIALFRLGRPAGAVPLRQTDSVC